jgi:F0F1-type ATP synthase assembly protein I
LEDDFDLKPDIISLIYSVQIMGFMPTSLLVHKFFDAHSGPLSTFVIALNFYVQGLATWCIGPSYLLRNILPNELYVTIPGIFFSGVGGAFTSIGAYQEIYEPIKSRYRLADGTLSVDEEKLTDMLSGLYNTASSVGLIAGPLLGSYIMILSDSFRKCSDYFAIFTLMFGTIMLVAVFLPELAKQRRMKT